MISLIRSACLTPFYWIFHECIICISIYVYIYLLKYKIQIQSLDPPCCHHGGLILVFPFHAVCNEIRCLCVSNPGDQWDILSGSHIKESMLYCTRMPWATQGWITHHGWGGCWGGLIHWVLSKPRSSKILTIDTQSQAWGVFCEFKVVPVLYLYDCSVMCRVYCRGAC